MEGFEVIIVGAGPAGATAAYVLAKAGLEVLLVERGPYPGSKNVSGGLVYTGIFNQVCPNFWEEAPVERVIASHSLVFLGEGASLSLDFRGRVPAPLGLPGNAYSVLRAKFDPWLAEKAEAAGATLITSITVDSLIVEDGRVTGIQAGPDELPARVVIDAEGSRSLLLKRAGLREDFHANEVSLGVKEVIRLPEETINQRFHCSTGEGMALTLVGHTGGVEGGGFLYTNRDSLSLGVMVKTSSLYQSKRHPHEVLDEFKWHPFVADLIQGGEVVEYSAQTVHRGGLHLIPKLYGDGYLIVGSAACLLLNNILTLRGMDLAVASGKAAAQAVMVAHKKDDFSAAALSVYEDYLKETSVYKDMETFRGVYALLENKRLFDLYPDLACAVMEELFSVGTTPGRKVLGVVRDKMRGRVSLLDVVKDMVAVTRGLVV